MSRTESTPDDLTAVDHDEVAEAALDHRGRRLLERPSGAAKTSVEVRWSATRSPSGSSPRADGLQDVALREDPGTGGLGIDHHGGADAALGAWRPPPAGACDPARP